MNKSGFSSSLAVVCPFSVILLLQTPHREAHAAHGPPNGFVPQTGEHCYMYAIQNLDDRSELGVLVLRGKAGRQGYARDNLILAPNTNHREWILPIRTLQIATADFKTPGSGNRFELPAFLLQPDSSPDPDGDGLRDLAEFILGSVPKQGDMDVGGIPDGIEVQQDIDPLEGKPASVVLRATANRLERLHADGEAGGGMRLLFRQLIPGRWRRIRHVRHHPVELAHIGAASAGFEVVRAMPRRQLRGERQGDDLVERDFLAFGHGSSLTGEVVGNLGFDLGHVDCRNRFKNSAGRTTCTPKAAATARCRTLCVTRYRTSASRASCTSGSSSGSVAAGCHSVFCFRRSAKAQSTSRNASTSAWLIRNIPASRWRSS